MIYFLNAVQKSLYDNLRIGIHGNPGLYNLINIVLYYFSEDPMQLKNWTAYYERKST
jgi:hypothetical protein